MSTGPEKNYEKAIGNYDKFYEEKLRVGKEYEEQKGLLAEAENLRNINGEDEYKKETFENEKNNLQSQRAKETDPKAIGLLNERIKFVDKLENKVRIYGFDRIVQEHTDNTAILKKDYPWLTDANEPIKLRDKKEFEKRKKGDLMEIEARNEYFEEKMRENLEKLEAIKKEHSNVFYRDRTKADDIFNNKFKNAVFESLDLILEKMTKDNSILAKAQTRHSELMSRLPTLTPGEQKEFNNLEVEIFALQKAREVYTKYLFVDLYDYALDSFKDEWDTSRTTVKPTPTPVTPTPTPVTPAPTPVTPAPTPVTPTPTSVTLVPTGPELRNISQEKKQRNEKLYKIIFGIAAGAGATFGVASGLAGGFPLFAAVVGAASLNFTPTESVFEATYSAIWTSKLQRQINNLPAGDPTRIRLETQLKNREKIKDSISHIIMATRKGLATGLLVGPLTAFAGILGATGAGAAAIGLGGTAGLVAGNEWRKKRPGDTVDLITTLGFTQADIDRFVLSGHIASRELPIKGDGDMRDIVGNFHKEVMTRLRRESLLQINVESYMQKIEDIRDSYTANPTGYIDINAMAEDVILNSRPTSVATP